MSAIGKLCQKQRLPFWQILNPEKQTEINKRQYESLEIHCPLGRTLSDRLQSHDDLRTELFITSVASSVGTLSLHTCGYH